MPDNDKAIHLGDGAYAEYDGYGVWLRANHHEARECTGQVYLEPGVFANLVLFYNRMQGGKENGEN